jgi:hypothetical protein
LVAAQAFAVQCQIGEQGAGFARFDFDRLPVRFDARRTEQEDILSGNALSANAFQNPTRQHRGQSGRLR